MENKPQDTLSPAINTPTMTPVIPSQQPDENPSRKKLFIIIGIVAFLIVLTITLIIVFTSMQSRDTNKSATPTPTPTQTEEQAVTAPTFKARTYSYGGNFPAKQTHYEYTITPFSKTYADTIANKLELRTFNTNSKPNVYEYLNNETDAKRGVIAFNKNSGAFTYESYGTFIPATSTISASMTERTTELLKYLELYDDTIDCSITYENSEMPGITFTECHRDWQKLSAPLLNLGGVLNLPEQSQIATLVPGQVNPLISLQDSLIVNVSNGGNGFARPNEFNTATVGFYPDGSLYSISSNLRKIDVKTQLPESELISPKEAYNAFIQGKGEMALTSPAGTGVVDYMRMYPNNTAYTEIAAISEITPAYLDQPIDSQQTSYEPYYLIKGTARLTSGYTVKFTQAIPARKSKLASQPQQLADENSNIQINTFTVSPKANIQPGEGGQPPSSTQPTGSSNQPTPTIGAGCQFIRGSMSSGGAIDVPGYGTVNLVYLSTAGGRTYSFVAPEKTIPSNEMVLAVKAEYFKSLGRSLAIYSAKNSTPITITNLKRSLPNCPQQREDGRCYNKTNETKTIQEMAKTLNEYSADQLKSMSSPISVDSILSNDNYSGSSPSQLLSWLFEESYERQQGKTNEEGTFRSYCYISGNSPHIFIHSKDTISLEIKSGANITFSDPEAENNAWQGKIVDSIFINKDGKKRPSIYYEYDPRNVFFTKSATGYIVERKDLAKTIKEISYALGLSVVESQALQSDGLNESNDLPDSKYIKLSFINIDEINKLLPLSIFPKPESITRIHIMISAAKSGENIEKPKLQKIQRKNYSVLELGAYAKSN